MDDEAGTLTDDEIQTVWTAENAAATGRPRADDGDDGDDAGDTGDDTGDVSDTTDTGDDSGDTTDQ